MKTYIVTIQNNQYPFSALQPALAFMQVLHDEGIGGFTFKRIKVI